MGQQEGCTDPECYNVVENTKMRFYGPFAEGYHPTIDEDLSGTFFPCESIRRFEGRMVVSSYNIGTRAWGDTVELKAYDAYTQNENTFPLKRGTYWYQDQGPTDTDQGATGYIFQMNFMDREIGQSLEDPPFTLP